MRISDWSSDVCSSDLVAARPLFDDRLFVAFPEGEEPPPASISTDQIDERRLLLLEDGHCTKDHALAACNRPELRAEPTMLCTSLHTIVPTVDDGLAATLPPQMAIDADTHTTTRRTAHHPAPPPPPAPT